MEGIIIGGGTASGNVLKFGRTNGENGLWDRLTTMPTGMTPIRYNGVLRATQIYGVYYSDNADLAETYEITGDIDFGDLVAINEDGTFSRNTIENNNRILGFVSDQPGFVLGGAKGYPIALAGRVYVNCIGDVRPGDYLTGCKDKCPGYVYATKPINFVNHIPGSIVGIALENNKNNKVLAMVTRM